MTTSKSLLFSACCAVLLSVTAVAPAQEWNVRDHVARNELYVMGHRGMGEEAPEGTLESFRQAWALGFIPEADIRTTRDGVVVSFHDDNFSRIIPDAPDEVRKQGVKDLDYADLLKLDVGAYMGEKFKGQRAVSIDVIMEDLKKDPKRSVICDLKNVDLAKFAEQTKDVWSQIWVTSSNWSDLKKWKALAPKSKTRLWTPRAWLDQPGKMAEEFKRAAADGFKDLDVYEIHAKFDSERKMTPSVDEMRAMADEVRRHDIVFEVMPLTEQNRTWPYKALLDAGVSGLSSDYPTTVAKALDEYYASKPE